MSDTKKGVWIPLELLMAKNLTQSEKILIADIMGFPEYWKTNSSIAKLLCVVPNRASIIVNGLVKKKIIIAKAINGKEGTTIKRLLSINRDALKDFLSPYTPIDTLSVDEYPPIRKEIAPLSVDEYQENKIENKIENKVEEATGVDDFHQVAKSYSDNIHPLGSQIEMEHLKALTDDFGKDTVIKAIEIAVMRNNKSLGYIKGILNRWETHGFDDGKPKPTPKQGGFSEASLKFMREREERKKKKC